MTSMERQHDEAQQELHGHDYSGSESSHHSSSETPESSVNKEHPLHALSRLVGDGIQSHVRKWKRECTRKKLESHLTIVQQARLEVETQNSEDSMSRSQSLQSLGDIGMTLFSPLDFADNKNGSAVPLDLPKSPKIEGTATVEVESDAVTVEESDADDHDSDVFICDDGTELESPRLLTMEMMRQLRQAMPSSTQLKIWKRLYSLSRDGDVFQTFLSCVAGNRQTLLVIQTSMGEIFGGFAEAHWGKLALKTDGSYHGTGRSFLFSIHSPEQALCCDIATSPSCVMLPNDSSEGTVTIHPWQGVNEYSILCSTRDGGRLAMGGGGKDASFGFCVQDHFTKGSSGACATFGNKGPLSITGHFDIVDFEVYGFVHSW